MHLVDRFARLVEELQAAARISVAVALLDREAVRPELRENPQVDVVAEHEAVCVADVTLS